MVAWLMIDCTSFLSYYICCSGGSLSLDSFVFCGVEPHEGSCPHFQPMTVSVTPVSCLEGMSDGRRIIDNSLLSFCRWCSGCLLQHNKLSYTLVASNNHFILLMILWVGNSGRTWLVLYGGPGWGWSILFQDGFFSRMSGASVLPGLYCCFSLLISVSFPS